MKHVSDYELAGATLKELAAKHGVSVSAVHRERRRRGIRRQVSYEPLLGTLPDAEIARRHGVTRAAVQNVRAARGIPRCKLTVDGLIVSEISDDEFLNIDEADLAASYGVPLRRISQERRRRGIYCIRALADVSDTELLENSQATLAAKYGVSKATVSGERAHRGLKKPGGRPRQSSYCGN